MKLRGETRVQQPDPEAADAQAESAERAICWAGPSAFSRRPVAAGATASKYTVPTINLSRYEELVPKDGVYITRTRVAEECFDSVTNVGNRPTFGADSFAIETHLLNFHPIELTPETEVEIFFLQRLREEIKFPVGGSVATSRLRET